MFYMLLSSLCRNHFVENIDSVLLIACTLLVNLMSASLLSTNTNAQGNKITWTTLDKTWGAGEYDQWKQVGLFWIFQKSDNEVKYLDMR